MTNVFAQGHVSTIANIRRNHPLPVGAGSRVIGNQFIKGKPVLETGAPATRDKHAKFQVVVFFLQHQVVDLVSQALRDAEGELAVRPNQEDRELLASVTAGRVYASQFLVPDLTDPLKGFIAGFVAMGIVYSFKMVHIAHNETGRKTCTSCALHFPFKGHHQIAKIKKPGKCIHLGEFLQSLTFLPQMLYFIKTGHTWLVDGHFSCESKS